MNWELGGLCCSLSINKHQWSSDSAALVLCLFDLIWMFLTFLTAKLFETNAALIAMRGEPLYASGEIFQHESQRIPAAESCTGPVLLTGRVQPLG